MLTLRRLALGDSGLTLGTSLVGQLLVLVSGVVAARLLGAEDRGYLALFWLGPVTAALIGGLGVPQATTFYVAKNLENAATVVRIASRLVLMLSLVSTLCYGLVLLLTLSSGDSRLVVPAVMSLLLIPAIMVHNTGLGALQGQLRFKPFNFVRLVAPALYAVGVATILYLGFDSLVSVMTIAVASWTLGAVCVCVVLMRFLPESSGGAPVSRNEMLQFGIRGVLGSVSPVDDLRIDQFLVGLTVDARALGLYVAAVSFCNLPRFIARSIGLVSYPRIASAPNPKAAWDVVRRSALIGIGLVTATVAVLFVLVPTILPLFFGSEFEDAVPVGQLLLVGTLFLSFRFLFTEFCRGLGHPGYGSIGEVVSTVLLLLGVFVLHPSGGAEEIAETVIFVGIISSALLGILLLRLRPRDSRN